MKNWFCILLALVGGGNIFAAEVVADFTAANKFYAEGKFSEAATAYQNILKSGAQSPALWFNAGNAEFKAGHLGRAIAAYRQAEMISPRDPELRANLAFVRNQVQGATTRTGVWQNLFGVLTLNEITLLAAIGFWLSLGLFAVRQLRTALVQKFRTPTRLAMAQTFILGAVLAWAAVNHFNSAIAIVTTAEAAVRSGPFDEAQSAFAARDGAELRVLDRHDDWVQVANDAGKTGWLNKKQIEVLPGA